MAHRMGMRISAPPWYNPVYCVAYPSRTFSKRPPMAARRLRVSTLFTLMASLYAAMQLYGVERARGGLLLAWPETALLVGWVALMTVMPMLIWRWEAHDRHRPVVVGAWVGYTWMGFAFLFFWIALCLSLLAALFGLVVSSPVIPSRDGFLLAVGLTIATAIYGFIDAWRPRIERVTLQTPKLPAGSPPLRIALISDVHVGAIVGARRLEMILEKLRPLEPDLLISAGDLVDGQPGHIDHLAKMLAAFTPRYGKYAVTGNHEYFVGIEQALAFHHEAGFTMLRGTSVEVGNVLTLAGVDDPTGRRLNKPTYTDETALFATPTSDRFTLLIKHQPLIDETNVGRFDLQVSGHVHKGQIFPFGLLVRLRYPIATGLTALKQGWIYVSRGTGTWGPPMRVGAAPEITLFEIVPAA